MTHQMIVVEVEGERDPPQGRRPPHDRVSVPDGLPDAVGDIEAGSQSQQLSEGGQRPLQLHRVHERALAPLKIKSTF